MPELELADRVRQAFERVQRSVFRLDPTTDPKLTVEVIDAGMAGDTPTLIVITPWTLSALAFPPDRAFPLTIRMSGRDYAAYPIELPEVGAYYSVIVAPDVSLLPSPVHARKVARMMAPLFRKAVEEARHDLTGRDASRRRRRGRRATCVEDPPRAGATKAL
jgi:[NiFe]-hydrogenase assembly, chaperone, HybE